jgi:DNA-binding GntR family transcriptional regulator
MQTYTVQHMTEIKENQAIGCYQQLLTRIQKGQLKPGDYLREQVIAEELGVSRTPVREALRRLESDGLVISEPRFGMVIRDLSYAEVIELYEIREVLERTAAQMSARVITDVELQELEVIQAGMEAARNDAREMALLNHTFHVAILNSAKNRYLWKALESVQKAMLILGPSTMEFPERAETAIEEHRLLLEALRARDVTLAEKVMGEHLTNAQRYRLRQFHERATDAYRNTEN